MAWRNEQAYSDDLRLRVRSASGTSREVAARFGVSVSYVVKARQRRDQTGEMTARQQRSSSMVRLGSTAAPKRLFFNLRRIKVRMDVLNEGDLAPEQVSEIAGRLDVTEQDVIRMNRRLAGPDRSLNAPARADGEEEWQDWLMDKTESQETAMAEREEMDGRKVLLAGAVKTLGERERNILFARRLRDKPATLEDLSQLYHILFERVRQIEVQAFGSCRRR